jgi:hypothetical protein
LGYSTSEKPSLHFVSCRCLNWLAMAPGLRFCSVNECTSRSTADEFRKVGNTYICYLSAITLFSTHYSEKWRPALTSGKCPQTEPREHGYGRPINGSTIKNGDKVIKQKVFCVIISVLSCCTDRSVHLGQPVVQGAQRVLRDPRR